ncbi:hypothetical protein ACSFA0_02340 [Variovorax sp. LT1P1]|uniref:hypothetical protein n=1 Tax=Variovorax sp. LT1P1 TaxID=3443730 RepID=UPI003F47C00C
MHSKYLGHYHRARKIAQCFTQTATLLYATCLKEAPRKEPLLIVPFVVNASFACELFLKALADRGGARLEGHRLSTLLATLPAQERNSLDQAWITVAQDFDCDTAVTLDSVIGELSNSFVDWRYSHERERVSTASSTSILLLLKALDDASQSRGDPQPCAQPDGR